MALAQGKHALRPLAFLPCPALPCSSTKASRAQAAFSVIPPANQPRKGDDHKGLMSLWPGRHLIHGEEGATSPCTQEPGGPGQQPAETPEPTPAGCATPGLWTSQDLIG